MTDNKTPATNEKGEFIRNGENIILLRHHSFFFHYSVTSFRNWIKDDPSAEYPAEANRYHLYVALACPWVNIHLFFCFTILVFYLF
jgi:putative glutathione S-transferase